MRRRLRQLTAAISVFLPLSVTACSDGTGPRLHPAIRSVTVLPADAGPFTSLHVELDASSAIEVTYWPAGADSALAVVAEAEQSIHEVFLPRLYASADYTYRVRAIDTGGRTGAALSGTFTAGALPDEVAALQFSAEGDASEPLALIEVMLSEGLGGGAIIVDEAGRIVWYWQGQGGMLMGSALRANGNWVFHDAGRLVEVTPDRRIVALLPNASAASEYGTIHHDVTVTPQNTLYFIANDSRVYPDSTVVGEAIWEWVPEQNRVEKKWSAFDFLSWPEDRGPDSDIANWMHMNSLTVGARGNVLYSSRSLDQVVSIAPDFSALEWRLGGINATIPVTGDAHFSGQHNISEVAPNRILMWDNGRRRALGEFSRGLELQVDPVALTATRVGEFRGVPDRLQPLVGGAQRLGNGNTLITYGFGGGEQINIYELATPDNAIRWHLVAPPAVVRIYKARAIGSVAGEVTVPIP